MPAAFSESEYNDRIRGKVPNYPLTKFDICIHTPFQANLVISFGSNAFVGQVLPNPKKLCSDLTVFTCSEERAEEFEKKLQSVRGLSYIKKPCPAIDENGNEVEVIDIIDGRLFMRDGRKVQSLNRNAVFFDEFTGYYVLKTSLAEEEKKDVVLKALERKKHIEDIQNIDKFDML